MPKSSLHLRKSAHSAAPSISHHFSLKIPNSEFFILHSAFLDHPYPISRDSTFTPQKQAISQKNIANPRESRRKPPAPSPHPAPMTNQISVEPDK